MSRPHVKRQFAALIEAELEYLDLDAFPSFSVIRATGRYHPFQRAPASLLFADAYRLAGLVLPSEETICFDGESARICAAVSVIRHADRRPAIARSDSFFAPLFSGERPKLLWQLDGVRRSYQRADHRGRDEEAVHCLSPVLGFAVPLVSLAIRGRAWGSVFLRLDNEG